MTTAQTIAGLVADRAGATPEARMVIDEPWAVSQRHGLAYTQLGNQGRAKTPLAARPRGDRRFR